MADTKKVKSTGRFGSRYGVGIRKRVLKVEAKQKVRHASPFGKERVKRLVRGIFVGSKTGKKFAGGAYLPRTMTGDAIRRMVSQKSFSSASEEFSRLDESRGLAAEVEEEVAAEEASAAKAKPLKRPTQKQAPAPEDGGGTGDD